MLGAVDVAVAGPGVEDVAGLFHEQLEDQLGSPGKAAKVDRRADFGRGVVENRAEFLAGRAIQEELAGEAGPIREERHDDVATGGDQRLFGETLG